MLELLLFITCLLIILITLSILLGKFISNHFANNKDRTRFESYFDTIEKPIFKLCGVNENEEFTALKYFLVLFYSNIILSIICFLALYYQNQLPYRGNVTWQLDVPIILHILSSLITNTCQTHHIPELHLTHLSNFLILPILMFYSSASGLATGIMAMRSIILGKIGNPYVDVIKSMTRILFPLCIITTTIFTFLGIPNTFTSSINYQTIEGISQKIILGPVAAFEAIKLIGENGQSCFNANSAHPFENPSYLSNFIEIIAILIVPLALIITMGYWLKNHKQSIIIISVLILVLIFEFTVTTVPELHGNQMINKLTHSNESNWVGKETRLGIVGSSVFEAAVSNVSGSANASLESFYPLAIALALFNLSNQAIFGVQGFGLVFTINFILYTTFFIGLMLGRTPEIFGKRIERNEIILSSVLLLLNPFLVLFGTVLTLILCPDSSTNIYDHVHYYTKVFYEFASGAASNGSGLESLNDNNNYWNLILALVMFLARYGAMSSMILLGGSLAHKPSLSATTVRFKTDTILFGFIFLFMSIISTTLIYYPFILLGPITEIILNN